MKALEVFKIIGGFGAVLGLIFAGLLGLSKFRNSRLRSLFEKLATGLESDKDKVHELELSVAKDEQKKEDIQTDIKDVDKEIEKVDATAPKDATNSSIINMFDKLSGK